MDNETKAADKPSADKRLAIAAIVILFGSFVVSGAAVHIWWVATIAIIIALIALLGYGLARRT